jgi:hypothetical protein
VRRSGDLDVVSYDASPATRYIAKTAGGTTYSVIIVEEAAVALVQREGSSGWAEVRLDDLRVGDASGLQVAAAAIDAAFIR